MKVRLDKQDELLEFVPCFYQFKKNDLFSRAAVGISKSEILIYPDMGPNEIDKDIFIYHPIATIPFKDIVSFVVSKVKNNHDLKKYRRFDIFVKSIEDCKILYVNNGHMKRLKHFVKVAKKGKIRTVYHTINYGLGTR